MYILLGNLAGLPSQKLGRNEYFLLIIIHSKHSKSKTSQDRFAAQLKAEYRDLMDTSIQATFSIQVLLCLLAAEIALACRTQDARVFRKVRGTSSRLFKWREILSLDLRKRLLAIVEDHDLA
jgi:hypothetical protein